jgi:hypothetical protein
MARIAGLTFIRDTKGRPTKMIVDLKKWGDKLEDFLDMIEVERRKGEPSYPLEDVVKQLDKKHGIKRK